MVKYDVTVTEHDFYFRYRAEVQYPGGHFFEYAHTRWGLKREVKHRIARLEARKKASFVEKYTVEQ